MTSPRLPFFLLLLVLLLAAAACGNRDDDGGGIDSGTLRVDGGPRPDGGDPDAGPGGTTWTSCDEAHTRARDGEMCTFSGSCGNCCCEGSTSCSDGRISIALCDCLCMQDAGP